MTDRPILRAQLEAQWQSPGCARPLQVARWRAGRGQVYPLPYDRYALVLDQNHGDPVLAVEAAVEARLRDRLDV